MTLHVGIDPGRKGAWAALSHGEVVEYGPLPYAGNELDVVALRREWEHLNDDLFVAVEKQMGLQKDGVTNVATIMRNYGRLTALLECCGIPHIIVTPQTWKKDILAGTSRDKAASVDYVRRRYPLVDLTPGRKRVPDDGIADAVCIAEHAARSVRRAS